MLYQPEIYLSVYSKKPKKESYRIVFGFECGGISPLQSEEEFANTLYRLENGLKDLPKGETLTVHFGTFANDVQRQQELRNLKGLEPELALVIGSERKRTQELTKEGIRKQSFLRLYATYTIEDGEEKASDWIEKSLQSFEGYWLMFTGQYKEHQKQKIELILKTAYREGYQRWYEILSQQLKLGIRPISDSEEWSNLWSRFNETAPRKIPYRIIYDGKNFTEDVNSNVHFISQLMESESSVPNGKRKTVEVNNKQIGVLLFADKPDGWADEGDQLRYLWEVVSKDRCYDTEIFCQLQRGNERLMREKLRSLTKQSHVAAALASEKNDVDVGAQLKAQKTIEAQASLIEGNIPLHTATVVLIHRRNTQDLDNACSNFIASFARQGWLVRETEYAWRVWCETFPQMTWDKLLSKPFKRLQTYQTNEVPGMMPLCKTPIIDDRGIEFISQEGGNPVYIDLYHKLRHVGVFGTTRSGKSLTLAQILAQALAHNIPATVLEFPKDDGTGTFSDFCGYLSHYCSYFDIGSSLQGCNILEPPNLRGLDPKIQEERLASYQEYLLEVLFFLVFAGKEQYSTEIDPERVRTLLILIIRQFYQDLQITNRFAIACIKGLGTTAWQSMPVLEDLLQFCSPERLELIDADESTIKALKYIKLRMMGWKETKVGKILSRPTSFATEKMMQVVALRGLGNNLDAAVIGMVFNLFAARRSLGFEKSIIFADEAPILFEYDSLARMMGQHFAAGAKSGIRVVLNAQEPGSIGKSVAGEKIFANMSTRIIGKVQPGAIEAYEHWMGYPPGLLQPNTGYGVNKQGRYSQWLLDDDGCYVPVRFYPSDILLSLAANNSEEAALRQRYLKQSNDKVKGLLDFSQVYLKQLVA
ncbi:hypothetical protein VB715_21725 [Crocosphaera sp. UHCC 0190]|uniref:hypothetical protein n=1 Tax=Crocosphaera sp. UHCC 0190 TaxID=3110246 RepID=UPI002B20F964|nr:hypothetical protein [Crocosphaera sp. UHCC 0190]MEA5512393.1 hypothetical protein [Crocosphaera sp. UHCC 0190]